MTEKLTGEKQLGGPGTWITGKKFELVRRFRQKDKYGQEFLVPAGSKLVFKGTDITHDRSVKGDIVIYNFEVKGGGADGLQVPIVEGRPFDAFLSMVRQG